LLRLFKTTRNPKERDMPWTDWHRLQTTRLLAGLAAALVLVARLAAANPPPIAVDETPDRVLGERLDKAIDRALAEQRIVGTVVLVARDGRLVYHRAAGLADREAQRAMSEDGVFRLASLTKSMVAAAAMGLIEEGALKLTDPVTKWLPGFHPALADGTQPVITVRHLLTHTSGLSYGFLEGPDHPYQRLGVSDGMDLAGISLDENLDRLAKAPLSYHPGSSWRYSLSMDVLGALLAKAAGNSLPDVVAARVTRPLGMASTAFAAADRERLVTPYADGSPSPVRMTDETKVPMRTGVIRFAPGRALDPGAFPSGGGGMVGTARDFLVFLETIRRGGAPILKSATVQEMMKDQVGAQAASQGPGWGFGYGWAVLDDPVAAKTPQAKGTVQWGGAYGHSWFVDPAGSLTVMALTNTAMEGMTGRFAIDVRNAVYGR
jgi:CubicO group peptidase (beta-lactamase class C family)